MGHPSPKYTAEFKQQAVRLYRGRGGTYAETARELGVDPGSLSDWVKRADAAQAPAEDNPFQMRRTSGASGARTSGSSARTRYF